MNFFKLYIGDYQRDTAHLSVTEHGAYMLMLQHYYATEKPLPVGKALHRMLRVQDKAEREAVDAVAQQFWRETPDGLVNDRADEEIHKAQAQADTNRRIAEEREARRKATRTEHDTSTNRATNRQPNHSHSQTPDISREVVGHQQTAPVGAFAPPSTADPQANPTPAAAIAKALRAKGIAANPTHPDLLALVAEGASPSEFEDAAADCVSKGKTAFSYVLATVRGRRRDAAGSGVSGPLQRPEDQAEEAARKAYEATQALLRKQDEDRKAATRPPVSLKAAIAGTVKPMGEAHA